MDFRQTNSDFWRKNCILDKQTILYEAIKHQRDKQSYVVHRADINYLTCLEAVNIRLR